MKTILLFILLYFPLTCYSQMLPFDEDNFFDPISVDSDFVLENLVHKFPDEILLKERLRESNSEIIDGEIHLHKVGNGLTFPVHNIMIKTKLRCVLSSEKEFLVFETKSDQIVAVLTENRKEANLAEFIDVQEMERGVGLNHYKFIIGSNPLRGEMFQLEWKTKDQALLRIVLQEKLFHYLVKCEKK
jgi:hypothetical protein